MLPGLNLGGRQRLLSASLAPGWDPVVSRCSSNSSQIISSAAPSVDRQDSFSFKFGKSLSIKPKNNKWIYHTNPSYIMYLNGSHTFNFCLGDWGWEQNWVECFPWQGRCSDRCCTYYLMRSFLPKSNLSHILRVERHSSWITADWVSHHISSALPN